MIRLWQFVHFFYRGRYARRFKTRYQLESHQQKRLAAQYEFARNHLHFYKNGPTAFPVLYKTKYMAHFEQLNRFQITHKEAFDFAVQSETQRQFYKQLGSITVGLSSGTTGHPGIFLASQTEQAQWAGYVLGRMLPRSLTSVIRKPLSIGLFLRANSNLYETLGNRFVCFHYFDMFRPFEQLIDEVCIHKPEVLVAPPSVLVNLAKRFLNGEITYRPSQTVSVAEVLEDDDRQLISLAFGAHPREIYQAMEGLLGSSCPAGNLILNEDIIHFDFESLGGNRVIPIITDLYRRTQPLIRYRLDDVLQLDDEPCSCGLPFQHLKAIEGRSDDVLLLPADKSSIAVFPDVIRRALIYSGVSWSDYRVSQTGLDALEIEIANPISDEDRIHICESLRKGLDKVGVHEVKLDFKPWQTLPVFSKRRRIQGWKVTP